MNNIIFKVLPKGEGKTKWLLDVAKKYSDDNYNVYLLTHDEEKYNKFCSKYVTLIGSHCPVQMYCGNRNINNTIILVDNLMNYGLSVFDLRQLNNNCFKLFVTIEGSSEDYMNNNLKFFKDAIGEQLRLF